MYIGSTFIKKMKSRQITLKPEIINPGLTMAYINIYTYT